MRHPRCQSANSNCGGLNLRLPRCMLWPSETLSPLSSLPVSASGRCLSVRLCPMSRLNGIRRGRGESAEHAAWASGRESRPVSPPFVVSECRLSGRRVFPSCDVRRFGYWGTFGRVRDRLRVPPRDSRDGVVSVESISRAECRRRQSERPLSGSGRRHGRWVAETA
jgi:hypothetical protein